MPSTTIIHTSKGIQILLQETPRGEKNIEVWPYQEQQVVQLHWNKRNIEEKVNTTFVKFEWAQAEKGFECQVKELGSLRGKISAKEMELSIREMELSELHFRKANQDAMCNN